MKYIAASQQKMTNLSMLARRCNATLVTRVSAHFNRNGMERNSSSMICRFGLYVGKIFPLNNSTEKSGGFRFGGDQAATRQDRKKVRRTFNCWRCIVGSVTILFFNFLAFEM